MAFGLHSTGESAALIADFAEQTGVTYPLVPDVNFTRGALAFPSQGSGYPYPRDVVIDKNLVIRSIKSSFNVTEMDDLIDRLLNEP